MACWYKDCLSYTRYIYTRPVHIFGHKLCGVSEPVCASLYSSGIIQKYVLIFRGSLKKADSPADVRTGVPNHHGPSYSTAMSSGRVQHAGCWPSYLLSTLRLRVPTYGYLYEYTWYGTVPRAVACWRRLYRLYPTNRTR